MVAGTSLSERLALRLHLLRELATSLSQAQTAVLASSLDRLQLQTARQQALIEAMRALTSDLRQNSREADSTPAIGSGFDAAWQDLLLEGARVRYLNYVLGGLLRRKRRSIEILALLQASCAATYAQPKPAQSSAARRRER